MDTSQSLMTGRQIYMMSACTVNLKQFRVQINVCLSVSLTNRNLHCWIAKGKELPGTGDGVRTRGGCDIVAVLLQLSLVALVTICTAFLSDNWIGKPEIQSQTRSNLAVQSYSLVDVSTIKGVWIMHAFSQIINDTIVELLCRQVKNLKVQIGCYVIIKHVTPCLLLNLGHWGSQTPFEGFGTQVSKTTIYAGV